MGELETGGAAINFETLQLDSPDIPELCREKYRALLGDWPAPGEFCPRAAAWAMAWLTETQEQALSQPAEGQVLAAPRGKWEGGEYWMPLAWQLCADECGEDACNELVWEGGPIPEPWGDRWLKYEHEAKRLISLVHEHAPYSPTAQPVQVPEGWRHFLTDIVTAAGLLEHGKRDKGLAHRIGKEAFDLMLAAAPLPPAQPQEPQEPVNRRLLDALRAAKASLLSFKYVKGEANTWTVSDESRLASVTSAIAEAEAQLAAQPVGREALSRKALVDLWGDKSDGPSNSEIVRFGREVERAHGITGEGA